MILQPQTNFVIVRQLEDPADVTVYYIQAEIRDARTDELLATVNLVSKGNGRWTKAWQVVADPTSQGRYLIVTTRVYTDAGYTTLSESYGAEGREYLVQRLPRAYGGGGGVSKEDVQKLLREELAKVPRGITAEDLKDPDLSPVMEALQGIKIPEQARLDLAPVLAVIAELRGKIEAYRAEGNAEEETDWTPCFDRLESAIGALETVHDEKLSTFTDQILVKMDAWYDRIEATFAQYLSIANESLKGREKRNSGFKEIQKIVQDLSGPDEPDEEGLLFKKRAASFLKP